MTPRNGALLNEPVIDSHSDVLGDMFVALVVLLATVDKRVRPLADQLVADPDTDPARVLWFTANYGARTFPARILGTEAVRQAILREIDGLHLSTIHSQDWRTPV